MPVTVAEQGRHWRARCCPPGAELTGVPVHPVSLELMANLQRYQA